MGFVGYAVRQHNGYYQTHRHYFMTIRTESPIAAPREICFSTGDAWIMKLTPEGVRFNNEAYPNLTANEIAKEIVDILEKNFAIEFKQKSC